MANITNHGIKNIQVSPGSKLVICPTQKIAKDTIITEAVYCGECKKKFKTLAKWQKHPCVTNNQDV